MSQPPPTPHASRTETRHRLLEAAGEVFAEYGFRRATIRDICRRANANVAAVHYHFGDKEQFYATVLRYAHRYALEKYPPHLGLPDNATNPQRLHAFVRSFLLRILDAGHPAWHGKLIAQEMLAPTPAFEALVEEEIRPLAEQLQAIVHSLLGAYADPTRVRLCALSIVGQCVFYHHARPVIARLFPEQRYAQHDIERLAEHVVQFSLAALQQLAQPREGRPV
jgi:AcrR family transcriptional regulator